MSEYEISEDVADRTNASNYDVADMIKITNDEEVSTQVEAE